MAHQPTYLIGVPGLLILAMFACSKPETPAANAVPAPPPAAAGPATAAPIPIPAGEPVTADGWGPVRIGMSEADAVTALGGAVADKGAGEPEYCHQLTPKAGPTGLKVMIEQGKVTRVSLSGASTLKTDKGLGLGATEAEVKAAYGSGVSVEPHKYLGEPAHTLTAWTVQGQSGVRYETDKTGKVTDIHAGGTSILYAEGCS